MKKRKDDRTGMSAAPAPMPLGSRVRPTAKAWRAASALFLGAFIAVVWPGQPQARQEAARPGAVPAPAQATAPLATLDRILARRAPNRPLSVSTEARVLRVGDPWLKFRVRSPRSGYLYVLASGTASELLLLFPNGVDQDNRVFPGKELELPRATWLLVAQGPPGMNRFVVVVTDESRPMPPPGARDLGAFADITGMSVPALSAWLSAGTCPESRPHCGYAAAEFYVEELPALSR